MKSWFLVMLLLLAGCVSTGGVNKTTMAQGYFQKGLAHFQEKNYELALVEFHRSIQTDRNNKMSYFYLGYISDLQDKPQDAIKYYQDAIRIDSQFADAYNALGATYSKQQKWDDALKAYRKALDNKLYTAPHVTYMNIGRVYMAQKEYAKAVEAFRDAKRYVKQDFIVLELGNALFEAGKVREAIAEFQEGVNMAPQNAALRYGLALAYLKDGNKKAAAAEFRKTSELAPKSDVGRKANDYLKAMR